MRVVVRRDLCIGAATCLAVAPEVFELDPENKAVVKNPAGASEDTLREAARACPVQAIYLYGEDGRQVFPPSA